jgi:RNA recognition motif-containing protein
MLFVQFLTSGFYRTYTNLSGNYCAKTDDNTGPCPGTWIMWLSMANVSNEPETIRAQGYFSLLGMILQIVLLILFRRHQRMNAAEIDSKVTSPPDFTIIVRNIPTNLQNYDYRNELYKMFREKSVPGKIMNVRRVVLAYNMQEIGTAEKRVESAVTQKQKYIEEKGFPERFDPHIADFDFKIQDAIVNLKRVSESMNSTFVSFCGTAFISFETEEGN